MMGRGMGIPAALAILGILLTIFIAIAAWPGRGAFAELETARRAESYRRHDETDTMPQSWRGRGQ